jgi:cystathionine beta-lyase
MVHPASRRLGQLEQMVVASGAVDRPVDRRPHTVTAQLQARRAVLLEELAANDRQLVALALPAGEEGPEDDGFDVAVDRVGHFTVKHEFCPPGVLPMWVADMELGTAPAVREALQLRAAHPTFGYTIQPEEMWAAVARWLAEQQGWRVATDAFVFCGNLVTATVSCLQAFTAPGDGVALLLPLYTPLQDLVARAGRRLVALPLASAACAGSGGLQYSVDLPALRVAFRDEGIRAIIWCSPHNPTGRVWRLAELGAVAALCQVVDVLALQPVRPIVKHNERCGLKC